MDKEKLKKIIRENFGIIIIVLIAAVILISLNMSQNLFTNPELNAPAKINRNFSINENGSTLNITDDDKNFKNWIYLSYRLILDDLNCVSKAAKRQNFSDTERCGRFLKDNSNLSLSQIDSYNISVSLLEVRDDYRKSLIYYNLGGSNLEIGARNRDSKQMYNATVYIQNGTSNMERVMILLGNDTKIPLK